jgi:hypothetical protein
MYCDIAEKSADTRAMMARCGSVMGDIVAAGSPFPDE